MIGRYVTGIGTGIETSTVPMYQAELCEARKRGRLVCSEALFVGLGIVICMLVSPYLESASETDSFYSIFLRLWHELCWGSYFLEVAHCVPDDFCHCMSFMATVALGVLEPFC